MEFTYLILMTDLAYLCISRFILLDSMLLFFTSTTLLALVSFHNERNRYVKIALSTTDLWTTTDFVTALSPTHGGYG